MASPCHADLGYAFCANRTPYPSPRTQLKFLGRSGGAVLLSPISASKCSAGGSRGRSFPESKALAAASSSSSFLRGRKLDGLLAIMDIRGGRLRRHTVHVEASGVGGKKEALSNTSVDANGKPWATSVDADSVEALRASLVAAELRAASAEKEKRQLQESLAAAEERAESYAGAMEATAEEAMGEVERARDSFKAEMEKVLFEKEALAEEVGDARNNAIDLMLNVERMASLAVEQSTSRAVEEATLRIAEARSDAVAAQAQVEERVRRAADEASAAVIEEARATIEDALEAAELAKEQARAAEKALRDRMGVLDDLARSEGKVIKYQETIDGLESKLYRGQLETKQLQLEIKAAMVRAEAAEARIESHELALEEIENAREAAANERNESAKRALDSLKAAAAAREEAAVIAYKAETDSLRAAMMSVQKTERVKEDAVHRRFQALEKALMAAEGSAKAWKERAAAVENLLKQVKERGLESVRESSKVEEVLHGGRMDVMLGDQKIKRKLLAEGPRRERPEWLKRKSTAGIRLPPLKVAPMDAPPVQAGVPLELPKPGDVWSIVDHQVLDDVFTKAAEAAKEEQTALEEQREQLELALMKKAPPRRARTPEEMEDKMGYMPVDYYNLNSAYGTEEDLKFCIDEMHKCNIQVLGDVVLNHRCASKQNANGIWNVFGGKLDWGPQAIVRDDPNFHGEGNPSYGDIFHAAPNVDHSQEFVRRDIKDWLQHLRNDIGYDGWRLDFVRGFWGGHVKEYIEASDPAFSIGEYWDSLAYEGGTVCYNQDTHRQRIINWINATGGTSSAFDVTTKGILHSALHKEYWRLIDPQGKPPGVMGWWPSRAVTFLENHDTGSTQGHWPFPRDKIMQGYAYILTHPGTPLIFYDHFYDFGLHDQIAELLAARTKNGIHCRSPVRILTATAEGYAAVIADKLVVKLGDSDWNPSKQNDLAGRWERSLDHGGGYQLWEKY